MHTRRNLDIRMAVFVFNHGTCEQGQCDTIKNRVTGLQLEIEFKGINKLTTLQEMAKP